MGSTQWLHRITLTVVILVSVHLTADACSMFTLSDGEIVLFANNEDYIEPGVIWFVPDTRDTFARVNLGFKDDFAQGSMNEKGLCFDAAVVPEIPWTADPAKKDTLNLIEVIMNTCASVDEAVALFDQYNCSHLKRSQFMFADATGNCAVVTWDPPGKLSVARKKGTHMLITNDRYAWSGLRDQRFVLGERALKGAAQPSLDVCKQTLDAMHQCGKSAFTSYSNVFDLKSKQIHLFNLGDFNELVTLDFNEEIKKGPHTIKLQKLFKQSPDIKDIRAAAPRAYNTEIQLPAEILARYMGTYKVEGMDIQITIAKDGERGLTFEVNGKQAAMFPESETEFRFRESFGTVTFDAAPSGPAKGFTLHRPGDSRAIRIESK
jgi:hypothetical protein